MKHFIWLLLLFGGVSFAADYTFGIGWTAVDWPDEISYEVGVGEIGSYALVRQTVPSTETSVTIAVPDCQEYHIAVRSCAVDAPDSSATSRCSAWTDLGRPAYPFAEGQHCLGIPPAPSDVMLIDRATVGSGG